MIGIAPVQGRVPYTRLSRRSPASSGPSVVAREAGTVERTPYGQQRTRRLCHENIDDERFTVVGWTGDPGPMGAPVAGSR